MHVTYSFCGRRVPEEVIERALEMFDEQVGLDQAISAVDERRRLERIERRERVNSMFRDKWKPGQPMLSDDLIKERRSEALMKVIERIAIYAPEDRELIDELSAAFEPGIERG